MNRIVTSIIFLLISHFIYAQNGVKWCHVSDTNYNTKLTTKITVQNTSVTVISINEDDYISLTDIAKYKSDNPNAVIGNWMRNRNTIEYLGIWETLYNPQFNPLEFEGFKKEAGLNAFTLSPQKWVSPT